MIGILIVTHGNLGRELLKSAELIMGEQVNVKTLGLNHGDDIDDLYNCINNEIKQLDEGEGVLVLTDLFGGSPSNVTAASMRDQRIESISGVNLPMIIEALNSRAYHNLEALVEKVMRTGVDGIKNIRTELKARKD